MSGCGAEGIKNPEEIGENRATLSYLNDGGQYKVQNMLMKGKDLTLTSVEDLGLKCGNPKPKIIFHDGSELYLDGFIYLNPSEGIKKTLAFNPADIATLNSLEVGHKFPNISSIPGQKEVIDETSFRLRHIELLAAKHNFFKETKYTKSFNFFAENWLSKHNEGTILYDFKGFARGHIVSEVDKMEGADKEKLKDNGYDGEFQEGFELSPRIDDNGDWYFRINKTGGLPYDFTDILPLTSGTD